ncbi:MAG TPA: paraquat-inducible protein A [Lacunisphaera sp.]|jgi:paraquat-inducible protein A|nr:paraquat-inducible protein A [Lacunisphaera sp.]
MKPRLRIPTSFRAPTDVSLPLAFTALVLLVAGLGLPLATATKFGAHNAGYAMSGIIALWNGGYEILAALVFACGILAPLGLVLSLCLLPIVARPGRRGPGWTRWIRLATWLEQWSMPEVQLLGVIVALSKLSALVTTKTGPGLWCYGLAAFFTLLAWRRFDAAAITGTPAIPA